LAYARFAQSAPDLHYGDAPRALFDAMAAYPELVSGGGRSDLELSKIGGGRWVPKSGAEGVQAIGIRSAGLGIAIKIMDGNSRALTVVAMAVLQQLGLLRASGDASLAGLAEPSLFNCNGRVVGKIRSVFKLKSSSERLPEPIPSR
jgi:L-asparaginase II